jgi:hypothetical protein
MPDADVLTEAGAPAEPARDRASFRLAVFGAVLVVAIFAGYGIGRLSASTPPAASAPAAGQLAAGQPAAGQPAAGQPAAGQPAAGQPVADDHGHDAGRADAGHEGAGPGAAPHDDTGTAPHTHNSDGTVTPVGGASATGEAVGGLTLTAQGLTLVPERTTFRAAAAQELAFRITGAGGAPVTTYAIVHDKPLHLILIRRDLGGFQHLHPTMAADGTWRVPLTLAEPGSYRAVADFTAIVGGRQVATTLGVDLTVPGDYAPAPLPLPARQADTGDFRVAYEGEARIGSSQPLLMTVTTQGRPAALEPYLGAYGHLVVLREGDVGYVHVHPEAALVDGKVKFWLAAPGPGRYRMFFDFQVGGTVHTAAWTTQVS